MSASVISRLISTPGQAVRDDEKRERAKEIAKQLGDNKLWHSHGRMIGPAYGREAVQWNLKPRR